MAAAPALWYSLGLVATPSQRRRSDDNAALAETLHLRSIRRRQLQGDIRDHQSGHYKQSGIGRESSLVTIEHYTQLKSVTME